jgi:hypothetical protein
MEFWSMGMSRRLILPGMADYQAAGRNTGALQEQGACGDDAAFADRYSR